MDVFDKNRAADLDFMIGLSERTATVVASDVIFMSLISIFLDNCLHYDSLKLRSLIQHPVSATRSNRLGSGLGEKN